MDATGCERSELQRFFCKDILFRRYYSFNDIVVLRHLELVMSTEKSQNYVISFLAVMPIPSIFLMSQFGCFTFEWKLSSSL